MRLRRASGLAAPQDIEQRGRGPRTPRRESSPSAPKATDPLESLSEIFLPIPDAPEIVQPLLAVIPLQLLAYHVALQLGRDIDKPRNLAKSVTVE